MKRRTFIKDLVVSAMTLAVFEFPRGEARPANRAVSVRYLRPPGALPEDEFVSRCIRCGQCSEVCPNRCIKFFGFENGAASLDTPYIIPREKACILCMKCGNACPTRVRPAGSAIEPAPYRASRSA